MKSVATAVALLMTAVCLYQAQAAVTPPVAKARVFGAGPGLTAKKIPGIDKSSNGLANVGKGSKVYVYCGGSPSKATSPDIAGKYWKSATYTFLSKPAGSATDFVAIDTLRTSFLADVEGTYKIAMVGTDDQGRTGGDTLVVNVAKYVGVGGIVGSAAVPECGVCHAAIVTKWQTTNHSSALQRKLDDVDTAASHFKAATCVPCHATGSMDAAATDGGWQDRAKTLGWTFPKAIGPGTFDAIKSAFPELAKMASIQCENCHGPGSAHMGQKTDNKIDMTLSGEQCKQCHDAPTHHTKFSEYNNSVHSNSMNSSVPENMNRGSATDRSSDCARCHTTNGYVDVFYKSADPSTALTKAPYKDAASVGCVACHDPHENKFDPQLRKEKEKICEDCHTLRVSSSGSMHHAHQGPMLEGKLGHEFPGYTYENSAHTNIAEKCVNCHMAVPDAKYQDKLGAHTFRVVYDNGTPTDATDDVVNDKGCISCHASGITMKDIEESQAEIQTLLDQLKSQLPKQTNGNPKYYTDTTMTQAQRDASFNYYFVAFDNSLGVHNHKYAKSLLEASINETKVLGVETIGAPAGFSLFQNYPNPFNPSTTINFSIPQSSNVRIVIYDAQGREAALLVNAHFAAGTYSARWNGMTVAGPATSGVYFYRIVAGDFTATKRMLLMK